VLITLHKGGKVMDKKPLIGVSICAVVLLVMGSLSNVVGYQTVQSSNQQTIKERINQRELLFQTIVDIANNKDIQRIILKSQMSRGIFPVSNIPIVTKNQLKQMYLIGLLLSKIISKSRMQSLLEKYKMTNPEIQKEISAVIEKDAILNAEIRQISNFDCDCENEDTTVWHFPVICIGLYFLTWFFVVLWLFVGISIAEEIGNIILHIAYDINCFFPPFP
jgi:hypothetical protein